MNLFILDEDIAKSAQALDDKRLSKMILETAQCICTVLNEAGYKTPYKSTHKNHPVVKWMANNPSNFLYACTYITRLHLERLNRFSKRHKSYEVYASLENTIGVYLLCRELHLHEREPFVNCSMFKGMSDTIEAYRETMRVKWANDKRKPTWTNRNPPEWRHKFGVLSDHQV